MVRAASLVEQLESNVRSQALIIRKRNEKVSEKSYLSKPLKRKSQLELKYPIGSRLVEFMEDRGLIELASDLSGSRRTQKSGNSYYLPKALYVVCKFDISLLPIKLNLPMVYPPLDWGSVSSNPKSLSDLTGGYLTNPTDEIYDRYRLLSGNVHNFYISLENPAKLCEVINALQKQPYQINKRWYNDMCSMEDSLVNNNLLIPRFLGDIEIGEVASKLRDLYMGNEFMRKHFSYNDLLQTCKKDIQRSRYEKILFELASAYEDYHFYLPAYLDFRGRIYRSGIMHFHERDIARSLIQFADVPPLHEEKKHVAVEATLFHFKSFEYVSEATLSKLIDLYSSEEERECSILRKSNFQLSQSEIAAVICKLAGKAKHPFQFISGMLEIILYRDMDSMGCMPITQDASASAYQIMSYLLLDEKIAMSTNLIQNPRSKIQDIYTLLLSELQLFIAGKVADNLGVVIRDKLTRKMVKGIFMPLIYGKTLNSTIEDIKGYFKHYLSGVECSQFGKLCFQFWKEKYEHMNSLITLIRSIGWLATKSGRPIQYSVANFTTVQDYKKMEAIGIWVYDKLHKKRRKVTLRVATDKRDSRKTEISTFVNFIHQKDAQIAMNVVDRMLHSQAPIYTVHDNFITTGNFSECVPYLYIQSIIDLGEPLLIINRFIYLNVCKRYSEKDSIPRYEIDSRSKIVIPEEELRKMLEENIPDDIISSQRKAWDSKINTILKSYKNYTHLVCGSSYRTPEDGWVKHYTKYKQFIRKFVKYRGTARLNCVHY